MTAQHTTETILVEIEKLEGRFDKHLEIYAANGRESKRVADALEIMTAQSASQNIKVNDMYTQYMDNNAVERATKRWQENVVTWGRVLTAIAVIGAAIAFLLEVLQK